MKYITIEDGLIYRISDILFSKIQQRTAKLSSDNIDHDEIYSEIKQRGKFIGSISMSTMKKGTK